jgi:hypothetical protein
LPGVGFTGAGVVGVGITGVGIAGVGCGVGFGAGRVGVGFGVGFGARFFGVGAASGTTAAASIGASPTAASTIGRVGASGGESLKPKRTTTMTTRTANAMHATNARLIAGSWSVEPLGSHSLAFFGAWFEDSS